MAKAFASRMAAKRLRRARARPLPGWLIDKAAPESAAPQLSPSRIGVGGEGDRERIIEGRLAHALLEMLPNLAPEQREGAAKAYLELRGGALAEAARAALAAKVLTTIGAPELADLFGPDSRGEVSLTGLLPRPGRPDLPFSGRLDRLVLTDGGRIDRRLQTGRASPIAPPRPTSPSSRSIAPLLSRSTRSCRSAPRSSISTGRRSRRSARRSSTAALDAVVARRKRAFSAAQTHIFAGKSEWTTRRLSCVALMRSHLLAKVVDDGERNGTGRAPKSFAFWFSGSLGGRRGAGPSRPRLLLDVLLAGGGRLAADTPKTPAGMVPYDHPSLSQWRTSFVAWRLARRPGQRCPPDSRSPCSRPNSTQRPLRRRNRRI